MGDHWWLIASWKALAHWSTKELYHSLLYQRAWSSKSLVDLLPWSTKNVLRQPPWSPLYSILEPSGAHFEVFLMTLRDNMDL